MDLAFDREPPTRGGEAEDSDEWRLLLRGGDVMRGGAGPP